MKYIAIAALLGLVSSSTISAPVPTPPYKAWESVKGNAEEGKYERVVTPHFATDGDDIFMRSMITKYAVEERTDSDILPDGMKVGGEATGKFWMTQATTLAAAKEVLNTHKGLSGDALNAYVDTYFKKAWDHFDVNQVGQVEVIKMPQFMRFLASDQFMSLGESG